MKPAILSFVFLFFSFQSLVFSQLPDGATAPDWTLTDINGNSHTLSTYLSQGKMVVLEFSATWCGPCWNYMMTGALETFWNEHGPSGSNDAMVFFIESDWSTGMADLLGLTPTSQGNWVANMSFPIIDLPPGNGTANQYQVAYYPTLYAICHDSSTYELGQVSAQTWSNFVTSCGMDAQVGALQAALCVGQGSVTVEATGGWTPYTYHWNTGATTPTISGLNSGNYSVTVTEAHGKISKLDVFVPGATTPVIISGATIEPTLCFGSSNGSVSISVEGGTPGYQYHWSNGANTQNLQNVPANNYSVTVTDLNGCTQHQSYTVDQPNAIQAQVETTTENCDQSDGTITLFITGGVGEYDITASSGTVYENHVLDLQAGNVDLSVTDQNGCIWTDEVTVGFLPAPGLSVTQGAEINCLHSTTTVSGFPTGGNGEFTYNWTTTSGHIISDPLSATISVDASGTYLLLITDVVSGCESSASAQVGYNISIPMAEAGEDTLITCEIHSVVLSGNGDSLNQVTWTTPNGNIVEGGSTYHPVVDASGMYFIEVTNPATSCSNTDSVIVADMTSPANSIFQIQNSGLTISAMDLSSGSNISGWAWDFGDSTSSNQNNVVHTYADSGTYQVCLSVQNGCGESQSCQMIEVISAANVLQVDAVVNNVICFGESTGSIITSINGGSEPYTYLWTGADTTFTTSSLLGIPAGEYQLVVSDVLGNIFIGQFTVDQPPLIVLYNYTIANDFCHGDTNGSINLFVSGGVAPYLFSWNGLPPQSENFLNQLSGGTFQALITDANGCEFQTGSYTVEEPDPLQLTSAVVTDASGPGQNNGSITLEISGGTAPYQVSWSNGATGTSINGLAPGEYTFTIIDANGCQFTPSSPVIVLFSTGISESAWPEYVKITPNPTHGQLAITWTSLVSKNASLSILTPDGKRIASRIMSPLEGVWDVNTGNLSAGLYIIILKQDKDVFPCKLIVL